MSSEIYSASYAASARVNHPRMTTSGRRWAGLLGILIAFALPKHVECGFPDGTCGHLNEFHLRCKDYEVEPFGFFLLESAFKRDIGFAYTSGEDCH